MPACLFTLLQITVQINEEVHEQNRALEQMQSGMGGADNLLTASLAKMAVSEIPWPLPTTSNSPWACLGMALGCLSRTRARTQT
jgi:hypothetical protein